MKKIIFLIVSAFISITMFGQAKKPTIMVVPSDNWCVQNNYTQIFDNQGTEMVLPDYRKALQNDPELLLAISKINEMMAERGFPLKNLESSLKTLMNQEAEDAMLSNKSGGEVAESPIDKLKKVAKADIWMQLTYTINSVGPKKSLTFNLQGLDAYTDKQIAGASGTGAQSFTSETAILIEEAILMHIDSFNAQLQAHFNDIFDNGREIVVRIKVWDDAGYDLEEEFDGEELGIIIEDWMADNTKNGRFNTTDATENMMLFEQVRIPLEEEEDGKVRQIDARRWVSGLRKHLKSNYDVESKLMMQGLGQAQLVIGSK
jgi:hypothetical protein